MPRDRSSYFARASGSRAQREADPDAADAHPGEVLRSGRTRLIRPQGAAGWAVQRLVAAVPNGWRTRARCRNRSDVFAALHDVVLSEEQRALLSRLPDRPGA